MTEQDLKYQDLKREHEALKEENQRLRVSNSLLEKELQQYRDLEEQGLLLKLPCKEGDKAYHVIEDNIANPPIYISEHEIKDVSMKAVFFADDWWQIEEMYRMNAFLTKEEAEQKLKELQEKEI